MRLFDLFEPTASILRGIVPRVWLIADKRADRLVIAEVHELHHDELIHDAADLAQHLGALHLKPEFDEAIEIVRYSFENADKDDVLPTRVLQLVKPHQHFSGMEAVGTAKVLGAGTLGSCLWLLLCPAKRQPADRGDAIDENDVVSTKIVERSPDGFEVCL